MKKVLYIGVFPPPYGGVTVKNTIITNEINEFANVIRINLYEVKQLPINLIRIFKTIKCKGTILVGLDSKRLKVITMILSVFPGAIRRTSFFLMGGLAAETIINDFRMSAFLKEAKAVLVETNGMKNTLNKQGFNNVKVYPNCKSYKDSIEPENVDNRPLQMVFFSQVSKEKGILYVERAVEKLYSLRVPFKLDIYGHIVKEIEAEFLSFVDEYENVNYKGVFDSTQSSVYGKLHEYDVLLFPSQWKAEGVPGVLVEAKMAGITVVASDIAYNEEIIDVENNEGIIIRHDLEDGLVNAIRMLAEDRERLAALKIGSYNSRLRYSTESHKNLLEEITGNRTDQEINS